MSEAVARLPEPDDDDVDFDLDAEDVLLREAIGQPLTVKVTGKVITIPHPQDWPHAANTAASGADFGGWAREVLSAEDHRVFVAANLRNYQVEALFAQIQKRAGAAPGKSPSSRSSSRNKQRR